MENLTKFNTEKVSKKKCSINLENELAFTDKYLKMYSRNVYLQVKYEEISKIIMCISRQTGMHDDLKTRINALLVSFLNEVERLGFYRDLVLLDFKYWSELKTNKYPALNFWHVDNFNNTVVRPFVENYALIHYSPNTKGSETLFLNDEVEVIPGFVSNKQNTTTLHKNELALYTNNTLHKCNKMHKTDSRILLRACILPNKDALKTVHQKRNRKFISKRLD